MESILQKNNFNFYEKNSSFLPNLMHTKIFQLSKNGLNSKPSVKDSNN